MPDLNVVNLYVVNDHACIHWTVARVTLCHTVTVVFSGQALETSMKQSQIVESEEDLCAFN